MPGRRWYAEPETFIAAAALVVSISAVIVGLYEASLQRHHDRAEVWPRLEIETFTGTDGATITVENTGIGPAVVKYAVVTVDGRPQRNWAQALTAWLGSQPANLGQESVFNHGLRAGAKVAVLSIPHPDVPEHFWDKVGRIGVTICYGSVFDEFWTVSAEHLGTKDVWQPVDHCPSQPDDADF